VKAIPTNLLRSIAAYLIMFAVIGQPVAHAYVVNRTISASGSCPQPNAQPSGAGQIDRRWNPTVGANIFATATGTARTAEVQQVILDSFAAWAGVGASLNSNSLASLVTIPSPSSNDCKSSDALNTICFAQSAGFQTGVLAFTTSITSDIKGEQFGSKTSSFIGQILDADVLFNPAVSFATPSALATNSSAYDLESVLAHELGHFLGLSHSSVLQALMYPFAPDKGTFKGDRPTPTKPDGPLADDDRSGLRVSYPNANDPNVGTITGYIIPANPLSLAGLPPPSAGRTVTGIFGAHVVAVDADTGAVIAGTLGGWSCDQSDLPTKFDGFYRIEGLPVTDSSGNPRHYKVFVEPLDLPTDSTNIVSALLDLCRQDVPKPCIVPGSNSQSNPTSVTVMTSFTTKIKP
jgi:hypothetical protein